MKSKEVTVGIGAGYRITIGMGLTREVNAVAGNSGASRIAVVADATVAQAWGERVVSMLAASGKPTELLTFPAGEHNKNQDTVTSLQHELLRRRYGRDTLLIALGGGVTGDLAGYVAATFLRGIPYIQMPTTLLAMVDSSVGGKVGIDTPYGKNMIGAFHQPTAVIIDLQFLQGLPREQVVNGLFEAIKTFLTSDAEGLTLAEQLDLDDPLKTPDVLQEIINRSVSIKAGITERDERETNERRIINFGHTVGHAIEFLSDYKMPHGYCVAYGILVETKMAELLGVLASKDREWITNYLSKFGISPEPIKKFDIEKIVDAVKGDKKSRSGEAYFVLLSGIGSVHIKDGAYAQPVSNEVLRDALTRLR